MLFKKALLIICIVTFYVLPTLTTGCTGAAIPEVDSLATCTPEVRWCEGASRYRCSFDGLRKIFLHDCSDFPVFNTCEVSEEYNFTSCVSEIPFCKGSISGGLLYTFSTSYPNATIEHDSCAAMLKKPKDSNLIGFTFYHISLDKMGSATEVKISTHDLQALTTGSPVLTNIPESPVEITLKIGRVTYKNLASPPLLSVNSYPGVITVELQDSTPGAPITIKANGYLTSITEGVATRKWFKFTYGVQITHVTE
jgi:hypothetical protein